MRKRQDHTKVIVIVLTIIVVIWIFINIFIVFNILDLYKDKEKDSNTIENTLVQNEITAQEIEENANDREIEGLKDADERTRIQQYCGKFIRYIENKEYSKAYDLLYPDFKTNYFPTLEEFSNYAKNTFPNDLIIVTYDNIERQGEYYILFTTITSPLQPDYNMSQRFALIENDFNDFLISFDVKQ